MAAVAPDAQAPERSLISWYEVGERIRQLHGLFIGKRVFGVPRGGAIVAGMIEQIVPGAKAVFDPGMADVIVDDLVDSGRTKARFEHSFPGTPFVALYGKTKAAPWLVMPWERAAKDETIEDNVARILQAIGEDPDRDGLRETPARVAKAWTELAGGYLLDPAEVLSKQFAVQHDQMVTVRGIRFYSQCEHHMLPFFGTVTIGYLPNVHGSVVGLSKMARLVGVFCRRLQVQERMTDQIADAIEQHLDPRGVGVRVTARHLCMEMRGVRSATSCTTTQALRGLFRTDDKVRSEFLSLTEEPF